MIRTVFAACALAVASSAWADKLYLSDYLGVPSGGVATASNAPYFSIVTPSSYGIGADRPGDFAANKIEFTGTGPLDKGIGIHSLASGFAEITFDLLALAPAGQAVTSFSALAGIDLGSGGFGRTEFQVLIDGVLKVDVIRAASDAPATLFVDTTGATTLTLRTHSIAHAGAHSAFGDASVLTSPVPEPGSLALLLGGGLILHLRLRRR